VMTPSLLHAIIGVSNKRAKTGRTFEKSGREANPR
jgi:hypothetical protein